LAKKIINCTKPKLSASWVRNRRRKYKKRGYKIIAKTNIIKKANAGRNRFYRQNKQQLFCGSKNQNRWESINLAKVIGKYLQQQKLLRAVKMYLRRKPKMLNFKPQIDVCCWNITSLTKALNLLNNTNAVEDWS